MDLEAVRRATIEGDGTVRPNVLDIAAIEDPFERLRRADHMMVLYRRENRRMSALRAATLLHLADEKGVHVKDLAEELGVSDARVRQILIQIRKDMGLPLRPPRGGKKPDPLAVSKVRAAVETLNALAAGEIEELDLPEATRAAFAQAVATLEKAGLVP